MAEQSYGDWIRSNPPLPTKEYQKKHMTTIEEAAERIYPTPNPYILGIDIGNSMKREAFKEGAKWQMAQQNHIGDTDKMVTAVEWFIEKVADSGHLWLHDKPRDMKELTQFIEHAKEMEKHQHGNTWDAAIKAHDERGHVHARSIVDFDEYFEDMFKK
jgi:hypothetical protein